MVSEIFEKKRERCNTKNQYTKSMLLRMCRLQLSLRDIYEFDHGLHGVIKTVCTSCHGWTRRKIKKAERYWIRGVII